jgi:hypothetical protein
MIMSDREFDKFARLLHTVYGLRVQFKDGGALIVQAPTGGNHPKRGKWFLVNDNGGEFTVQELNTENYAKVPYESYRMNVTTGTAAVRVAKAIAGEPIDWDAQYLTDEETDLLLSPTKGGGVRISYATA